MSSGDPCRSRGGSILRPSGGPGLSAMRPIMGEEGEGGTPGLPEGAVEGGVEEGSGTVAADGAPEEAGVEEDTSRVAGEAACVPGTGCPALLVATRPRAAAAGTAEGTTRGGATGLGGTRAEEAEATGQVEEEGTREEEEAGLLAGSLAEGALLGQAGAPDPAPLLLLPLRPRLRHEEGAFVTHVTDDDVCGDGLPCVRNAVEESVGTLLWSLVLCKTLLWDTMKTRSGVHGFCCT